MSLDPKEAGSISQPGRDVSYARIARGSRSPQSTAGSIPSSRRLSQACETTGRAARCTTPSRGCRYPLEAHLDYPALRTLRPAHREPLAPIVAGHDAFRSQLARIEANLAQCAIETAVARSIRLPASSLLMRSQRSRRFTRSTGRSARRTPHRPADRGGRTHYAETRQGGRAI